MTLGKPFIRPIIEGIIVYLSQKLGQTPTLSVAQLNIWNFFDPVDNPKTSDVVPSIADYNTRLRKLALTITTTLGTPNVISLNEIEDQRVLNDLLKLPVMKSLGYKGIVHDSNDGRGISVGVLYRGPLELVSIDEPNPKMSFKTDAAQGQLDPSLLYARAPLVLDFKYTGLSQSLSGVQNLTVAINHFKSKLGGDGPEPRRQMQGQYLGEYLDNKLSKDPNRSVLVIGDLNATYADGAYKNLAFKKDGSERLKDVLTTLPDDDRYTYIYRGKKDLLDHVMVTGGLFKNLSSVTIPHIDTIRGASKFKMDPTTVNGMSDHDPIVAVFNLA